MNPRFQLLGLALILGFSAPCSAGTYKCVQNGKTVIADVPCAAHADRVDQTSDKVSRSQQRQAEIVDMRNRNQLSELEWKARQERNYRGGVSVIPGPVSPADTPRRNR